MKRVLVLRASPARPSETAEEDTVLAVVAKMLPTVERLRAGVVLAEVSSAVRVFGGETPVLEYLCRQLRDAGIAASVPVRIGVADGWFAALVASGIASDSQTQHLTHTSCHTVPVSMVAATASPQFLAPLPVVWLLEVSDASTSEAQQLIELLPRLGLPTLGALAQLPAARVVERFGPLGARWHQLAGGTDNRPMATFTPLASVIVERAFDPPIDRIDRAAFASRPLADALMHRLMSYGWVCQQLSITISAADGGYQQRDWHAYGGFSAAGIVDRVRWQLDGWLASETPPAAPIVGLRLEPVEVLHGGQQLALTDQRAADRRHQIEQVIARVQGLLDPGAVMTAVPAQGRDPESWMTTVVWGQTPPQPGLLQPWPGRLPSPAPATILNPPQPVEVFDVYGKPVAVSGRNELSAPPAQLDLGAGALQRVDTWAGPWPADERWWHRAGRRRARCQMVTADGHGLLVTVQSGCWLLEARYD